MNQASSLTMRYTTEMLTKVPEMTVYFWITKVLTTGMGEVFSDFLAHHLNPFLAVILGLVGFVASLVLQFAVRRYIAWIYWLVVVMVSIFGTMTADALHIGMGIPYWISTVFFTVALAAVFVFWYKTEKTLSIHSIYTRNREMFYWVTVLVTFALGTASGDMTASTLHLGYFASGVLFTVLLVIPAIGYAFFRLNGVFAFWFAYIMTRPVGASFSDWISVPHSLGGLDWGRGPVSLVMTIIIVILVGYLQMTGKDIKHE